MCKQKTTVLLQTNIRNLLIIVFCCLSQMSFTQNDFSELLKSYNTESIPYINVHDLARLETKPVILDARELQEYKVSHLKNAIHIGYDDFNLNQALNTLKSLDQTIVVYCSLGVRSEDIAEQLKAAGYTNVYNLFGGIFEWKNNNYTVYDANEEATDNVHVHSEEWSSWLKKGTKIYD